MRLTALDRSQPDDLDHQLMAMAVLLPVAAAAWGVHLIGSPATRAAAMAAKAAGRGALHLGRWTRHRIDPL